MARKFPTPIFDSNGNNVGLLWVEIAAADLPPLPPGPEGPRGPEGPQGPPGFPGQDFTNEGPGVVMHPEYGAPLAVYRGVAINEVAGFPGTTYGNDEQSILFNTVNQVNEIIRRLKAATLIMP